MRDDVYNVWGDGGRGSVGSRGGGMEGKDWGKGEGGEGSVGSRGGWGMGGMADEGEGGGGGGGSRGGGGILHICTYDIYIYILFSQLKPISQYRPP
jgi:hypothetical protein